MILFTVKFFSEKKMKVAKRRVEVVLGEIARIHTNAEKVNSTSERYDNHRSSDQWQQEGNMQDILLGLILRLLCISAICSFHTSF